MKVSLKCLRFLPVSIILLQGCGSSKSKLAQTPVDAGSEKKSHGKIIVTQSREEVGTVVLVDETYRSVVLNFPFGSLPALQRKLNIYRNGLKVGEIVVVGPVQDDNIVADIAAGEAQKGDNVRAN